ncbi:glutathione peroxidase, partial [bacterium]|nr:glutathione peroxidase [bacterium]
MVKSKLNLLCSLFLISSFAGASPLDVKVKTIDGTKTTLGATKPKVVLVVNTASKCGFTRQYEELQALHKKYGEKGLLIAGFPCNQFGGQEPGTEADIKAFCKTKYDVTFPMFSK